jgi:hypothetical protein
MDGVPGIVFHPNSSGLDITPFHFLVICSETKVTSFHDRFSFPQLSNLANRMQRSEGTNTDNVLSGAWYAHFKVFFHQKIKTLGKKQKSKIWLCKNHANRSHLEHSA